MKNKACEAVCEFLVDSRGAITGMPASMRDHLASCQDCHHFVSLMEGLARNEGHTASFDYRAVDVALAKAANVQRSRKDAVQFICFLGAACAILAGVFFICAAGYALPVLAAQIAAFFTLPFIGVIIIARKLKGEFEWTP
jgi:hypothetical protein